MNPRVSRSSALASKATGFPIAKIAAKLAIGYTLDEIPNDITLKTPAAFEPALDYVVVKIPRFAFEKFPGADPELTTTMKSVGEAMSLGRNFTEALNKAMRSMETKAAGFWTRPDPADATLESTLEALRTPHDGRLYTVERALRLGASVAEVSPRPAAASTRGSSTRSPRWSTCEPRSSTRRCSTLPLLRRAKRAGLSDAQLAALRPELAGEDGVRTLRHRLGLRPVYKTVDTCAAEFAAATPYHYSSYDEETEVAPSDRPKVIILGSGPNRIGQGIEFDYSCVHAVMALRAAGFETVMVNCNPETVSTDYDTADRLYFEPLTFEDVLEVGARRGHLRPGGRRPGRGRRDRAARRADPARPGPAAQGGRGADRRHLARVDPPGRGPRRVRQAAGRGRPARAGARHRDLVRRGEAIADEIGYPVLVRPSYVLGGRGMEIVYDDATLRDYIGRATDISPEHPVLVDRFLDDAIEIDVDALFDATGEVYLGGVMEHIEEAGIHSGDSACALPPITLGSTDVAKVRAYTEAIARAVGVRGLLNVQYALKDDALYVLEANPRASRTVPFVSKATAVPLAKAAARIMLGATIAELRAEGLLPATGDGGRLPAGRADRGQGGGAAVQAVPHRRRQGRGQPARAGDEVDRRGDGHRHGVRARVRQVAGGGVRLAADLGARSSSRWPTATSAG